jgi:hypothetical protein
MFFASRLLRARAFSTKIKLKVDPEVELLRAIVSADSKNFDRYLIRMSTPTVINSIQIPTLVKIATEYKRTAQRHENMLSSDNDDEQEPTKFEQRYNTLEPYIDMLNSLHPYLYPSDYSSPLGCKYNGADANSTALSILASIDDMRIAEYFYKAMYRAKQLDSFADLNINGDINSEIELPLITAVQTGCVNTVYSLLAHGANPRVTDINKVPAIELAFSLGRTKVVACLLDAINNPRLINKSSSKPRPFSN